MAIFRAAFVVMAVATQLPQVRVCGCERAREREGERRVCERETERDCVCEREIEKERERERGKKECWPSWSWLSPHNSRR